MILNDFILQKSYTGVKNLRVPYTSERPSPIGFNAVKRDFAKTLDACTAYITTDMNGYPDVQGLWHSKSPWLHNFNSESEMKNRMILIFQSVWCSYFVTNRNGCKNIIVITL